MSHKSFPVLFVALMLAACQSGSTASQSTPTHPTAPVWRGAPKPAATGVGTLLGGWAAGAGATAALDDADRIKEQQAENRAYTASIGQKVTWNNPDSGNGGTIVPTRDGYDANGAYYREFQQVLTVGGTLYQGTDKASQQSDGTWKIVK